MRRLALIQAGVVVNVVMAASADEIPGAIDVTDLVVGPGYTYDGTTFTPPADVPPPKNVYTLAQFIDALQDAELDSILDLVNGDTGTTNQKRQARRIWEYWRAHNLIDFNVAKNVQVVSWFVTNYPLVWTEARKAALIG